MKRAVVTGLGLLTSIGNDVDSVWDNLIYGKSGIVSIDHIENASVKIAGVVKEFNLDGILNPKEARRFDKFVQYALKASYDAFKDSGLNLDEEDLTRVGSIIGTGIGGLNNIEQNCNMLFQYGSKKVSPFFVPGSIINMATSLISMHFGLLGPTFALSTACATGNHSIGEAFQKIQTNQADVMIAGSSEAAICKLGLAGFSSMRALSTRKDDPTKASRPWDKDRDGFVLSDGCGILILEELEHAKKRGAKIYAEVKGYGLSSDAYHISAPNPNGDSAALSMRNAILSAGLQVRDIDYINAHGTSTLLGDRAECIAIKKVFKEHSCDISISSTKSITGHSLGAAGSIEAIFSILALQNNIIPPTINLDNPEPNLDLDFTPHKAKKRDINNVLSNAFAFGGLNASLIFSKFES